MAGRNAVARFSVQADGVEQAKRELEGLTRQVDQLGETRVDGVRHELEQLGTAAGRTANSYQSLTQEQRQAYQQREQDAQQIERLRRSYKTLEGALEALDVQVQYGHRSAEEAARLQPQLAAAYARTGQAAKQAAADMQAGAAATRAAAAAQDTAHQSASRLRGVYQNLGYQVADVANQVGAGGNLWVALGMQVGQFLGVFGAVGAVAGAVVSIMGAVAGSVTAAGKSADQSGTAYTNLAKAMELAAKASGELKTASGSNRAALEAERRSVIAAREEIVKKAEAELLAIQVSAEAARESAANGAPEIGMAAGAYDEAAVAQKKRVSELRRELALLQGEYGIFNDGAREVTSATGKAGDAAKSYQEQIVKLRESLRSQITELGVQVETFDKSNAAKLRAKLQTEAMTAAGLADYKAVDAGTRALIDQAVARQEQIDRLEEQKKAQEEAEKQSEQSREEHEKAIESARDMVDRLRDETDQLGLTDRERAIFTRTLEAERQLRGKLSAGEMAEYLHQIKQEAGALHDATQARDRKKKADEDAVRALEKYQQDVARVATDIGKDVSENLWDQITGQAKADDALGFFKKWAKRLAVELLNQNFILPITAQIVGAVPGLFGIQAPAGANGQAAGGATGQVGGGLINTALSKGGGWAMDKLGLSGGWDGLMNTTLWGGSVASAALPGSITGSGAIGLGSVTGGAAQAAGVAAVPGGLTNAVAGSGAATVGLGSVPSGMATGGATVGGVLGAAGAGAFGGMLGGYIGTASGSKAVGGFSGAALGAGSAYLASIMGISSLGGPVGLAIGAVVGAIMGALGTQKPTVGPTVSADVKISGDGKSVTAQNFQTDNEGDAQAAQQLGTAFAGLFNIAAMGGGRIAREFGIGRTAKRGLYAAGSVPYREFGENVDEMMRYLLLDQGGLEGGGPNTVTAIRNSRAKNLEDAAKDIGLGAAIDAGTTALAELDKSVTGVEKAAKKATAASYEAAVAEKRRADGLGLGAEYADLVARQFRQSFDPETLTPLRTALATLDGQFAAMTDAVHAMGLSISDAEIATAKAAAAERLLKSYRDEYDASLRTAQGLGAVDQALAVRKRWVDGWRDDLAAGRDPNRLYGEQMRSLFAGVSDLRVLNEAADALQTLEAEWNSVAAGFARARADEVRGGVLEDLTLRRMQAQVQLGQVSQDAYEQAALDIAQKRELATVTDAAVRAQLEQVQAAERQAAATVALTRSSRSLYDWLSAKLGTGSAGISTSAAYSNALASYQSDLGKAAANDNDALGRIAQTADRLLTAYTGLFGSSGATDFWRRIMSEVAGLPAVKAADGYAGIIEAINRLPHANGGPASGLTMINDAGPELVRLPSGSHVMTSKASVDFLRRGLGKGGTATVGDNREVVSELKQIVRAIVVTANELVTELRELKTINLHQKQELERLRRNDRLAADGRTQPGRRTA